MKLLILPFFLLVACRDDPATVLQKARNALAAKDDAAFIALCEPHAAELLKRAPEVVAQSGRVYKVLRDGRPTAHLLPDGEVLEVTEMGHRAVVLTKSAKTANRVPMRLVDGQWRIDLVEMPQFAEATRPER